MNSLLKPTIDPLREFVPATEPTRGSIDDYKVLESLNAAQAKDAKQNELEVKKEQQLAEEIKQLEDTIYALQMEIDNINYSTLDNALTDGIYYGVCGFACGAIFAFVLKKVA